MGAALKGGPGAVAITGTAQNLLTLTGLPDGSTFGSFTVRAGPSNAGRLFFGPSTVTGAGVDAWGYLDAKEAISSTIFSAMPPRQFHLVAASPGDTAFIFGIEY